MPGGGDQILQLFRFVLFVYTLLDNDPKLDMTVQLSYAVVEFCAAC